MKKLFGIVGLCALIGTASGTESDGVELLYQRALHLETAKADYDGAIPIYATILSQHAQNAAIAAKALFRQGVCYEKTGKLDLARKCAQRLSGEFQEIAKADPDIAKWAERLRETEVGESPASKLSRIQLPEHPTKEQLRAYITAIMDSDRGRKRWSSVDPEVKMLTKVGPENIDLLIQALETQTDHFYLKYAILALADDQSKKLVLEKLETYPFLAEVVLKRGWEQDAREILLRELRNEPDTLPSAWIDAVVKLHDPSSYPLLRSYFIHGSTPHNTYAAIKTLPIENMLGAVNEAWARADKKLEWENKAMACIAADYGHVDALGWLFDRLAKLDAEGEHRKLLAKIDRGPEIGRSMERFENGEIRTAITRLTGLNRTNEEMAQWWKLNRGNLRFDPEAKKFVNSKSEATTPAPSSPKTLAQITLPAQPDKQQLRQYIAEVCSTSDLSGGWSSEDAQIGMLKKVGAENASLLVESIETHKGNPYLIYAFLAVADDRSKKAVLDRLSVHRELAEVVHARGWEKDARLDLIEGLKNEPHYLPIDWIRAVAKLNDPSTYGLLRRYFVHGMNKTWTYKAIQNLPIENLESAVTEVWEANRENTGEDRNSMALIAAENGHMDALKILAESLDSAGYQSNRFAIEARKVFSHLTGFKGTRSEAASWFKTNRDRLKFDPATKKFVIATSELPSASTGNVK